MLHKNAHFMAIQVQKNALKKQYRKLFSMENVDIEFRHDALKAIAKKALQRKAGARGLRSILEHILLDTMYQLPSLTGLSKVVIDAGVINNQSEPTLIYEDMGQQKRAVSE